MKIKLITLFAIAFFAAPAYCSKGESEGPVKNLKVFADTFMFKAGTRTDQPTCSKASGDEWAINSTTPRGKSFQSLIMLAYSLGKSVHVIGLGECPVFDDHETPDTVYIVE